MTALPLVAPNFADMLTALGDGKPRRAAMLASETGRDPSNTRRTLLAMEGDGYVLRAGDDWTITPEGQRARRVLDLLEGRFDIPDGYVAKRHNQLRPNPNNPRKTFPREELEELAASILAADGGAGRVWQNLTIQPEGEDGLCEINMGERRWRAVGLLIDSGQWDPDRPFACLERYMAPQEARAAAIVENVQRSGLPKLEEADGYIALMEGGDEPLTAVQAAALTGAKPRYVQALVQVRRDLPREALMMLQAGDLTWDRARELVRTPREGQGTSAPAEDQVDKGAAAPAAQLPPRQVLILAEVQHKLLSGAPQTFKAYADVDPRLAVHDPDYAKLTRAGLLMAVSSGAAMGVRPTHKGKDELRQRDLANPSGDELDYVRLAARATAATCALLREQGTFATQWLDPAPSAPPARPETEDEAAQRLAGDIAPAPPAQEPPAEPMDAPATAPDADSPERQEMLERRALRELVIAAEDTFRAWRARTGDDARAHWAARDTESLANDLLDAVTEGRAVDAACLIAALRLKAGAMGVQVALLNAVKES